PRLGKTPSMSQIGSGSRARSAGERSVNSLSFGWLGRSVVYEVLPIDPTHQVWSPREMSTRLRDRPTGQRIVRPLGGNAWRRTRCPHSVLAPPRKTFFPPASEVAYYPFSYTFGTHAIHVQIERRIRAVYEAAPIGKLRV